MGLRWAKIAKGDMHTCLLRSDSTVWCWGYDGGGRLGHGTQTYRTQAEVVQVTGLTDVVDLVASASNTCALTASGEVWCWGENYQCEVGLDCSESSIFYEITEPARVTTAANTPLPPARQLTLGRGRGCATLRTGELYCWGEEYGDTSASDVARPVDTTGVGSLVDISTGRFATCVVGDGGQVWCMGRNINGLLGQGCLESESGCVTSSTAPLAVQTDTGPLTGARQVAVYTSTACAVLEDDTVWCWGHNTYGQLGIGSDLVGAVVDVPLTETASQLTLSDQGACALGASGVWCWGSDGSRDGAYPNLEPMTDVAQVVRGQQQYCARKSDGSVTCWGERRGCTQTPEDIQTQLYPIANLDGTTASATDLAAAAESVCAVLSDGRVWCWGESSRAQLGAVVDGSIFKDACDPVEVTGLAGPVASIVAAHDGYCVLLQSGAVQCWGRGYIVGNGGTAESRTAADVVGLDGTTQSAVQVFGGYEDICAQLTTGELWCWGRNDTGQVGIFGDFSQKTSPQNALELNALSPSPSAYQSADGHACVLDQSGAAHCWGDNSVGQLATGDTTFRASPVASAEIDGVARSALELGAGQYFTCARLDSGSVRCWGSNQNGELGDGAFLSAEALPILLP